MLSIAPSTLSIPPRCYTIGECPYIPQAHLRGPNRSRSNNSALPSAALHRLGLNPILAKHQLLYEHRRRQPSKQQSSSLPDYPATRNLCYYAVPPHTAQPRPPIAPIAPHKACQQTRMTSTTGVIFSQALPTFTGYLRHGVHMAMDMGEELRFEPQIVTSPDTINNPPSTGSNSCFPFPSMSALESYEENSTATQEFGLPLIPSSYPTIDVPAPHSSIYSSPSNQMYGDLTLGEVAHNPNLDVTAQYLGIHTNLFNHICGTLTLSEVPRNPNLCNCFYLPVVQDNAINDLSIVPPVPQHAESTKRRETYPSPTKSCDYPGCGIVFDSRNSGNLARHRKSVHTPTELRNENLKCPYCDRSYSRLDGKRNHIRRKHSGKNQNGKEHRRRTT